MNQNTDQAGTTLLERPPVQAPPVPQAPPPVQKGMRFFWPAVVVIVGGLAALLVWAVVQTQSIEDASVPSTHDSGLELQLRQVPSSVPSAHDSGIQARIRQGSGSAGVPSTHDSGIQARIRQGSGNAGVPSTHDSGFAPFLRQQAGRPSDHDSWAGRFNRDARGTSQQ